METSACLGASGKRWAGDPLAVECLAKITGHLKEPGIKMYIRYDEIKPILKAGLNVEDNKVREIAGHARENFLLSGRF
jgi:hypothetical protein